MGSTYDILIVGGGIAGLSAAIALGNRGMKTELVEAGGEPLGAAIGVHGCAIDALGIAPMLGQRVRVRSRCHHCGEPLELEVDPAGSGLEAEGVMVWVGKQGDGERRASTSL